MMIIDFHTHVLPPRIKEDRSRYVDADPAFAQIYSDAKAKIATAEDLIDNMDRDGVDISVIVNYGWKTHELCVETNDYILESIARYPKRLYGFCAVSSYVDDISLKEIVRCAKAGAKGVGEFRPDEQSADFTSKDAMTSFVDLLQEHGLILLTHASEPVGHIYPGKGEATPGLLYQFIVNFPDLPVVCAHWGGGLPFYALMPEVRKALENVYFDTAASPFLYVPEIYQQVSQLVGADKILFGSDYPLMPPSRLLKEIETLGLAAADKTEILSGNARRLLGM
ncbi:MAG: amidohydrolase [Dehalococcoidales bacterium]|nr:amidohydrolase [Dehalococcoidales bacterium]